MTELHLDLIGGIAGDMFVAGTVAAIPDLQVPMLAALGEVLPPELKCHLDNHTNGGISGLRFRAEQHAKGGVSRLGFREVCSYLEQSALSPAVRRTAIELYRLIAEAEAAVHGCELDQVHFHELGDWDSVADVIGCLDD